MEGLRIGAPIMQVYHEKSFILPDVSRVLACLYEKDVKFETHTASYRSLLGLQASSHAPVPFYEGPTFLEESREICRYIAEKYENQGYPFLLGKDALERASIEQWLHNEEHAFNPPSRALFFHLAFPLGEGEDDDIDVHTRKLEEVLEVYEQRLSDSEFLVGNKKNVRRWWDAISDRSSWKKVLRYMKSVEEKNKQEELKKQQQQQEEAPRTSTDPTRVDSRKQSRTEPRTILVPPADNESSASIVPRTKKPLPGELRPIIY
uniref:glutathione transferase n=1 Tax=Zea mays TaxID=4577 RepID=A0A804QFX2_MAIZE